jgi:hypothetical protein
MFKQSRTLLITIFGLTSILQTVSALRTRNEIEKEQAYLGN